MASIDECIDMLENYRDAYFQSYVENLDNVRKNLRHLKHLKLVETGKVEYDKSKLVISVKDTKMTGKELHRILLKKYHLEMELSAGSYVLAMTSIGDKKDGMDRLVKALYEIDEELDKKELFNKKGEKEPNNVDNISKRTDSCEKNIKLHSYQLPELEQVYPSAEAIKKAKNKENVVSLEYKNCVGYISTEYAYLYPPGIPIIVPGEQISNEAIKILIQYECAGFDIEGAKEEGKLEVLK